MGVTSASDALGDLRREALAITEGAVAEVSVEAAVTRSLRAATILGADSSLFENGSRVTVLAVGKAAPKMTLGALSALDALQVDIADVLVVTSDGTDASALETHASKARVTVLRASHPLPDERSVHAAERLLAAAAKVARRVEDGAREELLVLVSGGASALACAPLEGISLEEKRQIIDRMLRSGASVAAINMVRRHLSRIKGGGLRRAAGHARVRSRLVADVLVRDADRVRVGAPHEIGSGPSCLDPTSGAEALEALRVHAPDLVPRFAPLLTRTRPIATDRVIDRAIDQDVAVVATPFDLVTAAKAIAARRGYVSLELSPNLDPVDIVADRLLAHARALRPGEVAIAVGEPTVALPPPTTSATGKGGRAGRLALELWVRGLPADVAFVALASDGVDGSSGHAGAVVSGLAPTGGEDALARFDDAPFLAQHGAAISSKPTGSNLLDLHVLVRARS